MSTADEGAHSFDDGRPQEHGSFTCPRCGHVNRKESNIVQGYCGACHDWTKHRSTEHLRVFHSNGAPPPADVLALVDLKGGYWPRVGPSCWNCRGNEPHAWSEMVGPFVEAPRLPTANDVAAAVAADEAWRKQPQ